MMTPISLRVVCESVGSVLIGICLFAADANAGQPLDRIPPGTSFVGSQPPAGWSNIVLFVDARLARGDVDAVSDTVKYYTDTFHSVILANTKQTPDGSPVLDRVAIGISMVIEGRNTVVSSSTHSQLNSGLGLIGGQVLAGNESSLDEIQIVGKTERSLIIDAPTMMLRGAQHRAMVLRFAIWADPAGRGVRTVVWLLDLPNEPNADFAVAEDSFQYLPINLREDRMLSVKQEHFNFLGIPKKEAFAVVQVPQGTPFPMTPQLRDVAGTRGIDAKSYKAIWEALTQAMRVHAAQEKKLTR